MTTDSIPPALLAATESMDPAQGFVSQDGPGLAIRQARERARLSLEELAVQTKLARSTLESLECDDFAVLAEAVYVRGYYRKCAKVLGLNAADLLSAYERLVAPRAPPAPTKLLLGGNQTMSTTRLHRRGMGGRTVGVVLGAAVLGALAWFLTNDPDVWGLLRKPVAPAAVEPALPQPAPVAPATPATESPAASLAPASTEAAPGAVVPGSEPSGAAPSTVAATVTAPVETAAESGGLVLTFKSTSWVRVDDADGRLLLSGLVQAGDRQRLVGRKPYALHIGNAPGVRIEDDGKPFDLTPYVRADSTARITIP